MSYACSGQDPFSLEVKYREVLMGLSLALADGLFGVLVGLFRELVSLPRELVSLRGELVGGEVVSLAMGGGGSLVRVGSEVVEFGSAVVQALRHIGPLLRKSDAT